MHVIPGGLGDEPNASPLRGPRHQSQRRVVAALNLTPTFGDVEGSLSLAERLIREAKRGDPSLGWVVLPELFTSGYSDLASIHRHAEDASHGMSAWRLSNLAHELGVYIAYGFPEELECGGVSTSANLVGPDGPGALLTYRKIHLVKTTPEHAVFTPGTEIPVIEAGGVRVALLICWDLGHPMTVRKAALAGADLILAPAAWRDPWGPQYDLACAARALDNGVYLASANQLGAYPEANFSAPGGVHAPDGCRVSLPDGVTSVAEIDPDYPARWRASFGDALDIPEDRNDYSDPDQTTTGTA